MVLVSCSRCAHAFDAGAGGSVACPRCGNWQSAGPARVAGRPGMPARAPPSSDFFPVAAPRSPQPTTAMVGCFILAGGVGVGIFQAFLEETPAILMLLGGLAVLGALIVLVVGAKRVGLAQRVLASIAIGVIIVAIGLGLAADAQMQKAATIDDIKAAMVPAVAHDVLLVLAVTLALWCIGRTLERSLLLTALVGGLVLESVFVAQIDGLASGSVSEGDMRLLLAVAICIQVLPLTAAAIVGGALLPKRVAARPWSNERWAARSAADYGGFVPVPPAMPGPPAPPRAPVQMRPPPSPPRLVPPGQPAPRPGGGQPGPSAPRAPAITKTPMPPRPAAPKAPAPRPPTGPAKPR